MKKKITATITAAAVFFTEMPLTFTNMSADAVSYDMILQAVYNVDSDEQIAVDLNIVKNNGFISGAVDVDWNKDALTLVSVEYDNDVTQESLSVPVDSENGDTDGNYRV